MTSSSELLDLKKPRNRSGGVLMKVEDVKMHANDFNFNDMCSSLQVAEKEYIETYKSVFSEKIKNINMSTYSGETLDLSWNGHYSTSRNHFPVKNYIFHAFPILQEYVTRNCIIMECGCGTGSTLIPLLYNFGSNPTVYIGFDVSVKAIEHMKENLKKSNINVGEKLLLFEYDIAANHCSDSFEEKRYKEEANFAHLHLKNYIDRNFSKLNGKRCDIVLLVFVLSALRSVDSILLCLRRLWHSMEFGGLILFRDYAIGDHNFFRYITRNNGIIDDILFTKEDGTSQVFFCEAIIKKLFVTAGFECYSNENPVYHCNRIHNRKNGKTMNKIFINSIFRKI